MNGNTNIHPILHGFCTIQIRFYQSCIPNRYFPVGIGRYFSVFTISIPKEISVDTFRYDFFGGKPYYPQKGGNGPPFEEKGGTSPLFDTASPPFEEKRSSRQIGNTDRKYRQPNKSDTGKIPIPKKLLVTPWYTTLDSTQQLFMQIRIYGEANFSCYRFPSSATTAL